MEIDTLLFFLLVIIASCLVLILYKELFIWNFNPEKKLKTVILDFQKKKKLCSGRITFPTKKDFQKYNVVDNDSNFLFEKMLQNILQILLDDPTVVKK